MLPHIIVPVKKLHPDAVLPQYQSDGAAGMDLCAENVEHPPDPRWPREIDKDGFVTEAYDVIVLEPNCRLLIGTGIAFAIPPGFEGQIRPRSGLAVKHGITVLNTPGTIDSDYRGEIKVLLINLGSKPFVIKRGDRIAQIVFAPIALAGLQQVDDLDATARGAGGFGSTGVVDKGPYCKGSWSIGNNCKTCWRCLETKPAITVPRSVDVGPVATTPFYKGTLVDK